MTAIKRQAGRSLNLAFPIFRNRKRFRRSADELLGVGLLFVLSLAGAGPASAEEPRVVLDRGSSTIVLEPYAPNVVRVTLSLKKDLALTAPGYGFVGTASDRGWTHQQGDDGDVYRSSRMVVTVGVNRPGKPMATQLDIAKFFNGSAPPANIKIQTPDGKTLLQMTGWSMSVPNHKDGNAGLLNEKRPSDPPISIRSAPASFLRMTSTTTVWDSTRRVFSIIAGIASSAGTIIWRRAVPRCACRSWSPITAMESSGTILHGR